MWIFLFAKQKIQKLLAQINQINECVRNTYIFPNLSLVSVFISNILK